MGAGEREMAIKRGGGWRRRNRRRGKTRQQGRRGLEETAR